MLFSSYVTFLIFFTFVCFTWYILYFLVFHFKYFSLFMIPFLPFLCFIRYVFTVLCFTWYVVHLKCPSRFCTSLDKFFIFLFFTLYRLREKIPEQLENFWTRNVIYIYWLNKTTFWHTPSHFHKKYVSLSFKNNCIYLFLEDILENQILR